MKIKYRFYFPAVVLFFALTAAALSLFSGCSDSTGIATGAISGDISAYAISVQGDIYVVAVKA